MEEVEADLDRALRLDGNAVAGLLREVFATEMTACPVQCANCGKKGAMGTLLAFGHSAGVTLRCSACEQIVLRIVETPEAVLLDARGAKFIRLERR
ncbi:MAG: DUF6510 family protein [Chloroflexota bacterium]